MAGVCSHCQAPMEAAEITCPACGAVQLKTKVTRDGSAGTRTAATVGGFGVVLAFLGWRIARELMSAYDSSGTAAAPPPPDPRIVFERALEGDANFGVVYRALHQHFPDDYDHLVSRAVSAPRGGQGKAVDAEMADFFMRHHDDLISGADEDLFEAAQKSAQLAALLQKGSAEACGDYGLNNTLPAHLSTEELQLVGLIEAQHVKAIASGAHRLVASQPPSRERLRAMLDNIARNGASETEVEQLASDPAHMTPEARCSVGLAMSKTVAGLSPDQGAFWYAYLRLGAGDAKPPKAR